MKKLLSLLIISMISNFSFANEDIETRNNIYKCSVFEPSPSGGEFSYYTVNKNQNNAIHQLRDGVHYLAIEWWSWTLNIGLHETGVIAEIGGGASHANLKLRFHSPDVSVECNKEL